MLDAVKKLPWEWALIRIANGLAIPVPNLLMDIQTALAVAPPSAMPSQAPSNTRQIATEAVLRELPELHTSRTGELWYVLIRPCDCSEL